MSEELCDELAKRATRFRMKFIGFGKGDAGFSGNAAGVTVRRAIHYNGPGVFVSKGITMRPMSTSTQSPQSSVSESWLWSVLDRNQKLLLGPQSSFADSLNFAYDNLDQGVVLLSREYLLFEVTSYSATSRIFPGLIWGIEFLFDGL